MAIEELTAQQLLSRLEEISASLRSATHFTNRVSLQSWTLLHGFTSPAQISLVKKEAMELNEEAEEQLEHSRWLVRQSRELSNRLGLSHTGAVAATKSHFSIKR